MIFDWIKNSELALDLGRFPCKDQWEAKHLYQQERCLVYFLQSKMPYEEAKAAFERVISNTDKTRKYLSRETNDRDFKTLWETAPSLSTEFKLRREDTIAITCDELKKINSLKSPKWYRCFVLLILGYYKFHRHYFRSVYLSKETMSWAYSVAHGMAGRQIEPSAMRASLVWRENAFCGKPLRVKPLSGKVGLMVEWAEEGSESPTAIAFSDPNDLAFCQDMVSEWVEECPKCHRRMRMSRYSKSPYCVYCRQEAENRKAIKRRKKKTHYPSK